MLKPPPVLVVLGATGAGKSKLALELAHFFKGEIISADAMQMYKGLDIVTNKVTPEELKLVKHHVIDFLDPLKICTVIDFKKKALPIIEDLLSRNVMPVICGGTNYYIESLLWDILIDQGIDFEPKSGSSQDEDDESVSNAELHERLAKIDPDRASELHPNDRRKVVRSLQVFHRTGKSHSEYLMEQKSKPGSSFLGGPLRFKNCLVLWVQCDQTVLETRCDKRVDKMIDRGMIQELEAFHKDYNAKRDTPADYTVGIFQSIGFKEFHNYLILSDEEKHSEPAQVLFKQGVDQLKLVTRQYSRRQLKWIRSRFLNPNRVCPDVYAVDSTQPELWDQKCLEPAKKIVQTVLEGSKPDVEPVPRVTTKEFDPQNRKRLINCNVCHRQFQGQDQYEAHCKGRRHEAEVKKRKMAAAITTVTLVGFDEARLALAIKALKSIQKRMTTEEARDVFRTQLPFQLQLKVDQQLRDALEKAGIEYEIQ